ncbi:toll/interleukin-1 receptor domain-containing protein [Pseudoxanthomonas mexicana]|uniref:toll/interleukin-1 receptor domain-containing protein n=1 Tax=Pseudoxanthomonas mexicana TaxID=128785 RepID=UPI000B093261|nr:toll/interleukin-1 receptor domain-containing protein [Pseudoxanthomonas mexicana]
MSNETDGVEAPLARSLNPLVFISHDTRDAELAEAFSNLLKSVSAGVLKSFRTSDKRGNQGIEYGIEWYPEIIKNIQSSSDVVCLLTERSVDRPWILFEAGMAKGKLNTPILGVALGIELKNASTGPFAQFQNCADDEESLTKLVFQLVDRIPGSEPDRDTIRFQVGKFKTNVEEILKKLAASGMAAQPKRQKADEVENSSAKLFEEIKIMFQDLPSRIERSEAARPIRRKRRFHPGMLEDMLFGSKNPVLGVRFGLSLLRDTAPWIYDEGNALLLKLQSAKTPAAKKLVVTEFEDLLIGGARSPYLEKFFLENEDDYRLFHEVPRMIMHALERIIHE